jgi:hypothetical protein
MGFLLAKVNRLLLVEVMGMVGKMMGVNLEKMMVDTAIEMIDMSLLMLPETVIEMMVEGMLPVVMVIQVD